MTQRDPAWTAHASFSLEGLSDRHGQDFFGGCVTSCIGGKIFIPEMLFMFVTCTLGAVPLNNTIPVSSAKSPVLGPFWVA